MLEELILGLMLYAATATGLPVPVSLPGVEFRSQEELWAERLPDIPYDPDQVLRAIAFYDPVEDTIWLQEDWDPSTLADRATLLHEVTHYMQDVAGAGYRCQGALEKVAYDTMRRYIEKAGEDFEEVTEISPLLLMLVTGCHPRG